jgi:predicted RNA-binding Zn ribbon-like protein
MKIDPRPLKSEPLALDLLNTQFVADGTPRDLLAADAGLRDWLRVTGHARAPDDDEALARMIDVRSAIRAVVERPRDRVAREALNAVLARGRLVERLLAGGPERVLEVDDEQDRVPWLAAQSLLDLLREGPDCIRCCGNPDCVLYFYDRSRGHRRQWCSMAGCGNRMKARRHYARTRGA